MKPLFIRERVTQGDPLFTCMCFYAIALLRSLHCHAKWMQSWYADDSGTLEVV